LTCIVGVRYDALCDERLIEVPSTSRANCGATGTRKCHPQSMRRYRKDVQAHRKDADACCRMTTRLRVRRMKAVPTRIFTGRVWYVHQYMYTVIAVSCELTSVTRTIKNNNYFSITSCLCLSPSVHLAGVLVLRHLPPVNSFQEICPLVPCSTQASTGCCADQLPITISLESSSPKHACDNCYCYCCTSHSVAHRNKLRHLQPLQPQVNRPWTEERLHCVTCRP
jgi:hypothetical protein